MNRRRLRTGLWLLLILLCLPAGCEGKNSTQEIKELDYTVVAQEDLPAELKNIIDQKKTGEFKLTYADAEFLYIAIGYGKQPTGGYSIQIPRVYLRGENIVFESRLLGPEGEAQANISYPYAVIKLEKQEGVVLFE